MQDVDAKQKSVVFDPSTLGTQPQQQAAPDLNAFMAMADPFTAQGLAIYDSMGNKKKQKY